MPASDPVVVEGRDCLDPECRGFAEPEQDGDHLYLSCPECGMDFGYSRVETTLTAVEADGSCSVGIPEALRWAASAPMLASMKAQNPNIVGVTIGKRPGL